MNAGVQRPRGALTGAAAACAGLLRRQAFAILVVASASAAYFWPGAFLQWGGGPAVRFSSPLIQTIMFGMGTTLTAKDFASVLKSPWGVAVGAFLQFSVMPLAAFCVARCLGFDGELAAGMVLIGSVAGGMASNVIAFIAKANVALSVSMTCVSTLLSPLLTPLLMKALAGQYVEVDVGVMMMSMVRIVVVPVAAGFAVRLCLRGFLERHKRAADRLLTSVSMGAVCVNLAITLAPNHDNIASAGFLILISTVLHSTVGFVLGYAVAKLVGRILPIDERDARTIAIEVGMQNGGMATALAVDVLKSPVAALPANAASLWMNVEGSLFANFWSRRPPAGGEPRNAAAKAGERHEREQRQVNEIQDEVH